jgi:hypothetical protein
MEFKVFSLAMNIENAQVHRMNHFEDRKCNPNGGFATGSLEVEAESEASGFQRRRLHRLASWQAFKRSVMGKGYTDKNEVCQSVEDLEIEN